jgi:hypothetical protein
MLSAELGRGASASGLERVVDRLVPRTALNLPDAGGLCLGTRVDHCAHFDLVRLRVEGGENPGGAGRAPRH